MSNNITFVTGFWNQDNFSKERFKDLLIKLKDFDLVVYIQPGLEEFVWEFRDKSNTKLLSFDIKKISYPFFPFLDKVHHLINSKSMDRPISMSKMFMLHNAKNNNSFNNTYTYWIDHDIFNSVQLDKSLTDIAIKNLKRLSQKMLFLSADYVEDKNFPTEKLQEYCETDNINKIIQSQFFGGSKYFLDEANGTYYSILDQTINNGLIGDEKTIFTIMHYTDSAKYKSEPQSLQDFFSDISTKNFKSPNLKKINLYIITYNAPNQLQMVLDSFEKYDKKFITETNLILINNSTKVYPEYDEICNLYDIKEYRFDNIGICGGRQWAAENFDESDADYMMFFEDDMLLDLEGKCSVGFTKSVNNVFENSISIMNKEKYDFIKLCFTEFYGNNTEQWSWHNLPMDKKKEIFGNIQRRPYTKFNHIKTHSGLPYAEGEVYYCNWPQIVSREGNKKMFLDTVWASPFEQTWMSHIYQMSRKGDVRSAVLLASPFTHNRVIHYTKEERREN